jgi:hypothetical protein
MVLASCATEPVSENPVEERNVFVENVTLVKESTEAVESVLVCGTWTGSQIARAIVNAIKVVPFFGDTQQPCEE